MGHRAESTFRSVAITDVAGVRVGHWSDSQARTGCTVVLLPSEGAVAGVDVRGAAPGTRETDLLRPGCTVERVHAVLLTGGSAFGLAAADGVMRWLAERRIGLVVREVVVPIVPAAVIFDLRDGASVVFPGPDQGYAACDDAASARGLACAGGRVGAGSGAMVGKLYGPPVPGGVGTASIRLPDGTTVGALAVVNAVGDVVDRSGRLLAGGAGDTWRRLLSEGPPPLPVVGASTTLAVVATDAALDKSSCNRLATVAHDALAMSIRPVHTPFDGDTVFALSVGKGSSDLMSLCAGAVEALRTAIERGVATA
ncbi:MAG: P1 family peptidase [Chloroflexi bacterium]|nr:MAG: P1 family peptidase [Chloroflexota bacterium]